MGLSAINLITEVQEIVGRSGDTELVTSARVNRWLNEAQDDIVRKCPGLMDTETENKTTLSCVSDQIDYTIGGFDPTACHILEVWHWADDDSRKYRYLTPDEFADKFPDPTSSDHSPDQPLYWTTYKNKTIRLVPRPSTDYAGDAIRVLYTGYADDITGADTSDLEHADHLLIGYGVWRAWRAIGMETKARSCKNDYDRDLLDYKDFNGLLTQDSLNIFNFEGIQ